MSKDLTLAVVDESAAAHEGVETSRAGFLKAAAFAGGTFVAGGVLIGGLPKLSVGAPSAAQDAKILNFALTLEFLEAEFYTRAERGGALSGRTREFARIVGAHERAHVAFLKNALGGRAVKKPRFNFHGTTHNQAAFQRTAQLLEDTGVKAYKGQAPRIDSDAILIAAAKIHSVEARHASWIRHIRGAAPAPNAFDPPASKSQILRAVAATGFIVRPRRAPGPAGGAALTGRA